jgi:lipopolysaccharide export system protein LptC
MSGAASERGVRSGYVPLARGVGTSLRRYRRFVGLAKWLLVAVAMALVIAVLAWPGAFSNRDGFRISFAELENADGSLTMTNPRFTGTDDADRPFTITATKATHDEADQNRITLHALQADVTMRNGAWLSMTAERGVYDRTRQTLRLDGPIDLFSDLGYEFHGTGANVDLGAGRAVTDQPVQRQGRWGPVRAAGLRFSDRGQTLLFQGEVRTTLRPQRTGS